MFFNRFNIFGFILVLFSSCCVSSHLEIVPGATWTVQNTGHHLQAHGGGIVWHPIDKSYYLIGENKTANPNSDLFQSISCYKSTDLINWVFVNDLLSSTTTGNSDLRPSMIIERPKVIYNAATKKYVLWMHVDNAARKYARAGVAYSNTVCGDYTYKGSVEPLGFTSRDLTTWVDTDGSGYLISEERQHITCNIYKLSDDFLSIKSLVYKLPQMESPAIFKRKGVYYILGSHLTGWRANDNFYTTATNLKGPWTAFTAFTPSGSRTFQSQTTFTQPIGSQTIMYMGDRWQPESPAGLGASTYIWLPLKIDDKARTVKLDWYDSWVIDPISGKWSAAPKDKTYQAEDKTNTLAEGAKKLTTSNFNGVTNIGGSNHGTLSINGITISVSGGKTTTRIKYKNDGKKILYGKVKVGSQTAGTVAFLPTYAERSTRLATVNETVIHSFSFAAPKQSLTISGASSVDHTGDIDKVLIYSV